MEKTLKGLPVARKIYQSIQEELMKFSSNPCLGIIQVGNDPASEYYVKSLQKKGKKHGIDVQLFGFPYHSSQKQIEDKIQQLNHKRDVHAVMLQKPLPSTFNEMELHEKIAPQKDVDGFHPLNLGNLLLNRKGFLPCTPAAVLEMIDFYKIETSGKHVVVIGRSDIVGKPMANLLLRKNNLGNATVTICHSQTKDITEITQQADILIPAIGRANFVIEKMIKDNVIILDVGVNQIIDANEKTKYVGDADYNSCIDKSLAISPVPGGIGTVTTAMLLKNVCQAFVKSR